MELGAPLVLPAAPRRGRLGPEEALAHGLALAHRDPILARVLPILIYRLANRLDWHLVRYWVERLGEERSLSFWLDLTAEVGACPELRDLIWLTPEAGREVTDFFETTPKGVFACQLAEQNTPPIARRWCYRMNMGMDAFETAFLKLSSTAERLPPATKPTAPISRRRRSGARGKVKRAAG